MSATGALAAFVHDTRWSTLPETTRHAVRRTTLNMVGLAVGAADHVAVATARRVVAAPGGTPQATVLGSGDRLPMGAAALLNGMAAHVEDFDDTHLTTVMHPGAAVVPAALAAGEHAGASGTEVLTAVAVGIEAALRVGVGICPGHFDRAWHVTGTLGHIGAAAAAARLLCRDADEIAAAIGLGATQAAGLTSALGTMTKSLHPGRAAADGVEAAVFARHGFPVRPEPLTGPAGFAPLSSPSVDEDAMLAGLGTAWEIEDNAFKPYACGIVSHAVIDAGIALRPDVAPDDIESVLVTVHPVVLEVMGVPRPVDGLQSKFSVYHCFAVGLLDGAAGPAQFSDAHATAPAVVAVRDRVRAVTDTRVPKGAAEVEVTTRSGARHRVDIPHATGSAERPMTDEQLVAKLRLVAAPVMGDDAAGRLADELMRLDEADGLGAMLAAARAGSVDHG